ncbi:S-2-haloacid dehalogenase I [Vibrio ishigakensis]|uniref:(S)-2-haloacid dehalogenase n=1 Tax=Vibrio ishigakensis TaxID=1481914 RepID=A0A0B8NY83_9VIBR|nr:haloacid dehalogenase type II [Vibrio ishigakensis]GAM55689.1 S-2-haloacid dehalogenase I [Vibrio ishigakensis]
MATTLAFDVYGTLIDTHGVTKLLEQWLGNKALAFSQTWRDKQLEYSFRRGLMNSYQPFTVCTQDALEYACELHRLPLSSHQRNLLMQSYLELPAFSDVEPALDKLEKMGATLVAFSNGEQNTVKMLLKQAGLLGYFQQVVSCEDVKTFKPNPSVYQHLTEQANSQKSDTWLVSSNSFDVIGARSFGLNAAWVKRTSLSLLDPWDITPNCTVESLTELSDLFS